MNSVFGWPDPNTGFNQSEHALYTCYSIKIFTFMKHGVSLDKYRKEIALVCFSVLNTNLNFQFYKF